MGKCFHVKFVQTDRWTDRQITVKQYAPDLSIRGHKIIVETRENADFLYHFFFYNFLLRVSKIRDFVVKNNVYVCTLSYI